MPFVICKPALDDPWILFLSSWWTTTYYKLTAGIWIIFHDSCTGNSSWKGSKLKIMVLWGPEFPASMAGGPVAWAIFKDIFLNFNPNTGKQPQIQSKKIYTKEMLSDVIPDLKNCGLGIISSQCGISVDLQCKNPTPTSQRSQILLNCSPCSLSRSAWTVLLPTNPRLKSVVCGN